MHTSTLLSTSRSVSLSRLQFSLALPSKRTAELFLLIELPGAFPLVLLKFD